MRILAIHAKSFYYDIVKPAVEEPEIIPPSSKHSFENALILFTTIESGDEVDLVDEAVLEIRSIIEQVKPLEV
ncbi:MAG: threonyl-tRNA synthetase editing domain-containing protein, partial [Desulfurococcaceae archaeon]